MKTLGGHPGTFTGEAFSGGGLESHPPLWMLTYSVAEANKRQKVISNFTSQGIHTFSCVTNGEKVEGSRPGAHKEFEEMRQPVYSFLGPL